MKKIILIFTLVIAGLLFFLPNGAKGDSVITQMLAYDMGKNNDKVLVFTTSQDVETFVYSKKTGDADWREIKADGGGAVNCCRIGFNKYEAVNGGKRHYINLLGDEAKNLSALKIQLVSSDGKAVDALEGTFPDSFGNVIRDGVGPEMLKIMVDAYEDYKIEGGQIGEDPRKFFPGDNGVVQQNGNVVNNNVINNVIDGPNNQFSLDISSVPSYLRPIIKVFPLSNQEVWANIFGIRAYAIYAILVSILGLLTLFSLLFEILYFIRKRRVWGVVYDSVTKHPLESVAVRLFSLENKKLLGTHVTDKSGRYNFLVQPGKYYVEANLADYHFPTRKLLDKNDGFYNNIYHGEEVIVKKEGFVATSIPIDPMLVAMEGKASIKWLFFTSLDLIRLPLLTIVTVMLLSIWLIGRVSPLAFIAIIIALFWLEEIYLRRVK